MNQPQLRLETVETQEFGGHRVRDPSSATEGVLMRPGCKTLSHP